MTDTPTAVAIATTPPRTSWKDVIPALALLVTLVLALLAGGKYLGSIESKADRIDTDHGRRILALETSGQRQADAFGEMNAKVSGMDAKLDLLLQRAGAKHP